MANPNIVNVTTIQGNTAAQALTTSLSNVVINGSASSTVIKINNLIVSNYGSSTIQSTVILKRGADSHYFAGNITIPSYSTLVVIGKDTGVYLLEGDQIQASATSNSVASCITSFETIS